MISHRWIEGKTVARIVLLSLVLGHQTWHAAACMRANPNVGTHQTVHAVAAKTTTTTTTTTTSTTTPPSVDEQAGVVESGGKVYRFQTEQQLQALYSKYSAENAPQQGVQVTNDTATDDTATQHLPCTLDERRLTRCVNGGTCFAVIILEQRHIACHCPAGFTGKRCEERVSIGVMSLDTRDIQEDDAGGARVIFIVVGVSVGVVVLSAVVIGLVVFYRRRHYQNLSKGTSEQLVN